MTMLLESAVRKLPDYMETYGCNRGVSVNAKAYSRHANTEGLTINRVCNE